MTEQFFDARTLAGREVGMIGLRPEKLDAKGPLMVGHFTTFTGALKTRGKVRIGKYCTFGDNCRLIAQSHDTQLLNLQMRLQKAIGAEGGMVAKGPITIGNNVWMGDNVTIMSGVRIGHCAIVGAGSVVTRDVAAYAIVAGVPAKFRRWRFSQQMRRQLIDLAWWDWPLEKMQRNRALFERQFDPDEDVDLAALIVP